MGLYISADNVNLVIGSRSGFQPLSQFFVNAFWAMMILPEKGQYDVMGFGKYLFQLVWFFKK